MSTAGIRELAEAIEKATPSAEELDNQCNRWFSQKVWHCPDHSYRSDQECYQDWIAKRFLVIAQAAGGIKLLCEQAEAEAEHRLAVHKAVQEAKLERIRSGGKP